MKVSIELDEDFADEMVAKSLRDTVQTLESMVASAVVYGDRVESVLDLEAAKRMHNYYSTPDKWIK